MQKIMGPMLPESAQTSYFGAPDPVGEVAPV
jgi:hypothetical protein